MTIEQRLEALAAGPKPFVVATSYACGRVERFGCHSAAAAESYASRQRRKVGRDLIRRETGETVRVAEVKVERAR